MAGRVEVYIHSDKAVQNKGACLIELSCETDFCARTEQFIDFSKKAAKMIYAFGSWDNAVESMPELGEELKSLSESLGEEISIKQACVVNVE